MRTEDLHIEWHNQDDIPDAMYARVLVRITEMDDGVTECPLWDVWTWHNQGQLYGFQQPDGQFLDDNNPDANRIRRFEWTYLSWAAHEKMIEDFGRKGAPATVYCVLRSDCESEDELQQVFDTREAAQDYADHQYNAEQLYVHEYEVRTGNEETGPVLWCSTIMTTDIETDLEFVRRGGFHPDVERSVAEERDGWMRYGGSIITFYFTAATRSEATKRAEEIARAIVIGEAEGKYPYLRRQVYRPISGWSVLYYPYYDFTTAEIILPENGHMEIPRSEIQLAADGTVLSPKFKEIDKSIL